MTCIALLNKSLDPPLTHRVNNRYVRIGMRVVTSVVALVLPVKEDLKKGSFEGIIVLMLSMTMWWEYVAGLDRGAKMWSSVG